VIPFKDRLARIAPDLWIRVHCVALDGSVLDEVRKTLQSCPGDKPVFLEIVTADGLVVTIRSGRRCGIAPTEATVERLKVLLGTEAVWTSSLRRRRVNGRVDGAVQNGGGDRCVPARPAQNACAAGAAVADGDGEE